MYGRIEEKKIKFTVSIENCTPNNNFLLTTSNITLVTN